MFVKPTFLNQNQPLNTCMIQATTPKRAINLARGGVYDGCDAFGFQYEKLEPQYHNESDVKSIFRQMGNRPIYVTSYRHSANAGKSDEELLDSLIDLVHWGATLADVMGDYYCKSPDEIAWDSEVIDKQKAAIERIHAEGGEVLMSSHTMHFMTTEEVMKIALAHKERGADISKIVTAAGSEEEELANLATANTLNKELGIPFLFLAGGSHHRMLRTIGPMYGCCMWLTVHEQDEHSTPAQPDTRAIRAIADNFDWHAFRRF